MAYKMIIKPIVFFDIEEAFLYYESKISGLGKRFYLSFLASIEKIESSPNAFLLVKHPVRRCKLKGFPFKVFYVVSDQTIFIIGLSHAKRSNAFVKRRLGLL